MQKDFDIERDSMKTFYITTAIDYPNGTPHMGHAYEKIVTDFYARWYKQTGHDVYFLTGTDENGQKLIQASEEAGQETLPFVDEQVEVFKDLCNRLQITNNDFIRTTEKRHMECCQDFWQQLAKKEYIYFDKYSGLYCYSCENFYTETQAPDSLCPHHHKPLEKKEEEGYFFKLSNFQQWILEHIKNNNFIMSSNSKKEILSRLEKEETRDLAISRPNTGWGVPVPGDDKFVMYTWFDALINYYSALDTKELREKFWPAQCHVIGKDIIWFHTVIWPCILKALEIEPPKHIYVHGMVLAADGKKMSKSLNNGVNPLEIMDKYPLESFRYYILRAIPAKNDGPFSEKDLMERHNSELGNDFGNLVMRVLKLSIKKIAPELKWENDKHELNFKTLATDFEKHISEFDHHRALDALWERIRETNQYINLTEPWKVKEDPKRLHEILYNCTHALHVFAYYLNPVMPEIVNKLMGYLGSELKENPINLFEKGDYKLTEPDILFQKFEL